MNLQVFQIWFNFGFVSRNRVQNPQSIPISENHTYTYTHIHRVLYDYTHTHTRRVFRVYEFYSSTYRVRKVPPIFNSYLHIRYV